MGKFAELMELSNSAVQDYKVAAKIDKFEKTLAAKKGDKEAADKAEKRQEGIDAANKRLATKAEGQEMGKFAQLLGKEAVSEQELDEASLRQKGRYENGERKATVHRDVDWNEYRVKHHINGVHQKEADYHTDDKEEAHQHADHWVNSKHESVELEEGQIDELSKGTLAGYLVANKFNSQDRSYKRGLRHGAKPQEHDTPEDHKDEDKAVTRQNGYYKALKKLMSKNEQASLDSFCEKAEEFKPHRSHLSGAVYHLNPTHHNQVTALKHGESKVIEAVHHDGYQLHVKKYEANRVRNTIHLHDRHGNHVDSFSL